MTGVGKRVLITGTTSGVGLALLEHFAARGARIVAVNRRLVPELEARHPSVRFAHVDVRSAEGVDRLLRDLAAAGELPEVFILNAGINRVDNDQAFQPAVFRDVLETNLHGVLHFVAPLTALPAGPRERHLIAISSMVTYGASPYGLGYGTSKQALTACFEAWSRMYAGTDLVFQQVILGPVPTAIHTLTEHLPAWMGYVRSRFSASPEDTARAIAGFASTRKPKLFYPRRALPLFWAAGLGQRLIPGFLQGRKTLEGKARRTKPP